MAGPIRRLDQIRALADPLRLRIVEALASEARTPKQVADLLKRKPTSLYHHVRVLEAAGLIRQTRTQKKRGTVERYYRAVHHEIRIDPHVFAGRARGRLAVMGSVLSAVEQELRLIEATRPMLGLRLNLDVQPARLRELEAVIRAWAAKHVGADSAPYHLALLAYPETPAAPRSSRAKRGRPEAG